MDPAGCSQRRERWNANFKAANFRSSHPRRIRDQSRRTLQPADPRGTLIGPGLALSPFVYRRVFHLCPHRVQIVRSGDHWKQQDQNASQGQQTFQRTNPARQSRCVASPPQPVSRQCQQQPREIKQKFHTLPAPCDNRTPMRNLVLQITQFQVNVTTVPPPTA